MDIINKYNIFLFDMYGVLWNGEDFYKKALDTLEILKNKNKIVYILSNTTQLSEDVLKKRVEFNEKNIDKVITSGDVLVNAVKNNEIKFNDGKQKRKVYIFGNKSIKLFDNTDYEIVNNIDNAEFVYISSPQFTEEEYNMYKGNKNIFTKSKNGNWDSIKIEPFIRCLKDFLDKKLPLLNANPDFVAQEVNIIDNKVNYIIRQGSIAEYYRKNGGEVVEFGKPNLNIYEYVFRSLENCFGGKINKDEIVMVGDTLRTDIKGAGNAGINSILFTESGVTGEELKKSEDNLEILFIKYDVKPSIVLKNIGELYDLVKNNQIIS